MASREEAFEVDLLHERITDKQPEKHKGNPEIVGETSADRKPDGEIQL